MEAWSSGHFVQTTSLSDFYNSFIATFMEILWIYVTEMVLLISIYERQEWISVYSYIYIGGANREACVTSLRGKRFRLITSSSLSSLGQRESTNVNIGAQVMHNFDMKQRNFKFFRERERQGDRLGRLLLRSNQISYIEWGWACREENNQSWGI